MVGILFDPPFEGKSRRGGALIGPQREEYATLCKQMTSRGPTLEYGPIRDRILEILGKDVRKYIETLPEEDRQALMDDLDEIFSTIDMADPRPLVTINIVSLQISLLFTQYEFEKHEYADYFNESYDTYKDLMENGNFKDYSYIKGRLPEFNNKTDVNLYRLLNPSDESDHIFMLFLGFLKLDEIVDSYLNNVFYLGLSYKTETVDGLMMYPFYYLQHDLTHYELYIESCPGIPTVLEKLKNFREYVKGRDKSVQYSIIFALFYLLHEEPHCEKIKREKKSIKYNNSREGPDNDFVERMAIIPSIIHALTTNIENFLDLNNFGEAIPRAYRESVEGSDSQLNPKKVEEYLYLVIERFIAAWKDFVMATYMVGGRRLYRRTKRNRGMNRTTRKGRK